MKHEIWQKPTLINFISCLTIYLCVSFSEWEIYPGAWSESARGFASLLMGLSSLIFLIVYLHISDYKDECRK